MKGGFYHDGRFASLDAVVDHYDRHLKLKLTAPGAFFSWITLPATVCWHRSGAERSGCGVPNSAIGKGIAPRCRAAVNALDHGGGQQPEPVIGRNCRPNGSDLGKE